ncbi:MAG: bifunctional ornithine acetyltransferase/N-acetylglutamate synthase, partial [Bacillota bacterium]
ENGTGLSFDEDKASKILAQKEVTVTVELKLGEFEAKAWGCDLSYDYVRINADYRT